MTEMIANRLKRIIKYTYNSNNFSWLKKEQMKSLFFMMWLDWRPTYEQHGNLLRNRCWLWRTTQQTEIELDENDTMWVARWCCMTTTPLAVRITACLSRSHQWSAVGVMCLPSRYTNVDFRFSVFNVRISNVWVASDGYVVQCMVRKDGYFTVNSVGIYLSSTHI